jgi:lactonase family protein with 7-bladed beta-propeller
VRARQRTLFFSALMMAALAWQAPGFRAHEHTGCGSVNNSSNNRITVFEILGTTGELKPVQEILTGGHGAHGGYYSIPQIAATPSKLGKACVFAANAATDDVSAFRVTIEQEPGKTCPCQHDPVGLKPFSIGSDGRFGPLGGGVALAPDGGALYTANPGSSNLSTFTVEADCGLKLVGPRVTTAPRPSDIQVKPDGRCLAVASPTNNAVSMYRIGSDRLLTAAGQFAVPGPGRASGVEFSKTVAMDTLYVAKADPQSTVIARYHVRPDCSLEGSPLITTVTSGRTSNVAKLDPENQCLYVPNQASASVSLLAANHPPSTLTTFVVDPDTGDLSQGTTVDDVSFYPAGLGFNETSDGQRFLYYTSFGREILRRPVKGCTPGPVTAPPVPTGVAGTGLLRTLAIVR